MKKRLQWKKAISTLLAVTMIGQSCLVTTADEVPVALQTVESQQSDAAAKEAAAKAAEKAAAEAAAKAESEKAAAEAAAKAESEKAAAEAAAKAESEKAAAEAVAKAESEKAAAEAAAKTESEKAAAEAAAKAESEKAAAEAATKTESEKAAAEAAAKTESEKAAAEAAAKAESEKAAAEAAAKAESEKAAADAAANAEAGKTDAAADKKDEKKDGTEKTITYRVTFAPQALDHGKIQVKGEEKPVEAVSSYYKEVEKNGSVVFTVTADDGYAVDHVMIEKTDLTKNAQGEYEITSIAKDTQIVVTYKELPKETADETTGEADKENEAPANDADQTGAEEQPGADADQQTKPAAPKHEEVSMHVGEDSWIVGEDGKDHSWDMLDNEVLSIVDKDGALVEVIGEAAGDVYLTHTYTAGEDVLMETFHVTVTEVEEEAAEAPEEAAENTDAANEADKTQAEAAETTETKAAEVTETAEESEAEKTHVLYINHILDTGIGRFTKTSEAMEIKDSDFVDGVFDISSYAMSMEGFEVVKAYNVTEKTVAMYGDSPIYANIKYAVAEGYIAVTKTEKAAGNSGAFRSVYQGNLDDVTIVPAGQLPITFNVVYENGTMAVPAETVMFQQQDGGEYVATYTVNVPDGYSIKVENEKYTVSGDGKTISASYGSDAETETVVITLVANEISYKVTTYVPEAGYEEVDLNNSATYTMKEETFTGKVGDLTAVTAAEMAGFTAKPVLQQEITADGNAEVVVEYVRNTYKVEYDSQGGSYVSPKKGLYESEVTVYESIKGEATLNCSWTEHEHTPRPKQDGNRGDKSGCWTWKKPSQGQSRTWVLTCGKEEHQHSMENGCYTSTTTTDPAPVRQGYTFEGWYTDPECTTPAEKKVQLTGDVKVYAKWEAKTVNYTVAYFKEIWDNSTNSSYYAYDASEVRTAKVGSSVTGSDSKAYKYYTYGGSSTETVKADGSTVVAVRYDLTRYTFVFDLRDTEGDWWSDPITGTIAIGGKEYHGKEYKIENVVLGRDISELWPSTENTSRDNGEKLDTWNGNYKTKRFEVTADMLDKANKTTVTYTAVWTESTNIWHVEYWLQTADGNAYEKSETYGQDFINTDGLSAKDIYGFKNIGTPAGYEGSIGKTKRFYYDRNSNSITYMYKDTQIDKKEKILFGANINTDTYKFIPEQPVGLDEEYIFAGWYDNVDCVGDAYTFTVMPNSNLVLYAKWVAPTKTLTLVKNNGTDNEVISVTKGETAEVQAPEREGFTFNGWFTDAACMKGSEFDANEPILRDTTIYAKWEENKFANYTVRYVTADGAEIAEEKVVSGYVGSTVTEKAIVPSGAYEGYAVDAPSKSLIISSAVSENVITFTYVSVADLEYKVQYTYNGVVKASTEWMAASAAKFRVYPDQEIVTGLAGEGYSLNENFVMAELVTQKEENLFTFTLKPTEYKITYAGLEGATVSGNPATYTIDDLPITLNNPTKDGYIFAGWEHSGSVVGGGEHSPRAVTLAKGTVGHLTFTAKWLKVTPYNGTYDAQNHGITVEKAEGDTVEYSTDGGTTWTETSPAYMDVASTEDKAYPVKVRVQDSQGWYSETVDSYVKINPATLYVTTQSENKEYDGEPLTAAGSVVGFVNDETATFTTTGSQTEVGDSDNTYILQWNGTAKEGNYTVSESIGTLTVTESTAKINVTTIGGTFTYDGKAHGATVEVTNVPKGYTVVTAASNATATDVTTADVPAKCDTLIIKNAEGKDVTAELDISYTDGAIKINPATLTVTTPTKSKVYDGTALTEEGTISGFVNDETATFATTGTQTEVGSSKNTYSITWDGTAKESNYTVSKTLGTLTVTEYADEIVVTTTGGEFPYDGKAHGATVTVSDLPTGYRLETATSSATATNVADETVAATCDTLVIRNAAGEDVTSELNITYIDGSIKITPATLTITMPGASKTYDGTALTKEGSIEGFVNNETATFTTTGTQTEVGNSKNTYSLVWNGTAVKSNYTISETVGTLVVTESTVEIQVTTTGGEFTYDGKAHGATVSVSELPKGYTLVTATSGATATDVTENPVPATCDTLVIHNAAGVDVTSRLKLKKTDGEIKINPATLTVKTPEASKVYDGTPLTAAGSITGFVNGEEASFTTTGTQTKVGGSKNTYSLVWDKTAKESNYTIAEELGTLTVTEYAEKITVTTTGGEFTYDGKAHGATVAVSALPKGYTLETATSNASATNVADETVMAKCDTLVIRNAEGEDVTSKLKIDYVDGTIRIKPAVLTVITQSESKVYDGTALTAPGTIEGFVNNETATFRTTGARIPVGTSDNTYSITWDGTAEETNYTISETIGKLTVTESTDEIVVTTTGGTFTYDGQAHGATVAVSKLPEGYTLETAASDATATDVTSTAVTANCDTLVIWNAEGDDVTSKLNIRYVDGSISVTPATLTVVTPDATKTYDGKPLRAAGSVSGFKNGETATFETTGTQTKVGSSENSYSLIWDGTAKATNYTIVERTGRLTVNEYAAQITVTTTGGAFTYDGKEHKAEVTVSELPDGYVLEKAESNASATDVTNEAVAATCDTLVIRNAEGEDVTGKLDIHRIDDTIKVNPATLTVVTQKAEKVYDGEALTAEGSIKGFVNGETAEFKVTGSQTEVGDSKNTYSLVWNGTAKKGNYTVSENIGTLKVTESTAEITVTTKGGAFTYDGMPHGATVEVSKLPTGYKLETAASNATATDVTTTDVTAKCDTLIIKNAEGKDVTAKLDISYTDGAIKINPATLTVTTPTKSKVYDGTALTAEGTISGFVNGETATFATTGTQTEVGSSKNTYSITWDGTAKESNYTVSETLGTLTVTEYADEIVVTTTGGEFPYDGKAHGATVTVSDLPTGYRLETATSSATAINVADETVAATCDTLVIRNAAGEDVTSELNITYTDGSIKITPATLTVTMPGASKTYDGTALTKDGSIEGFVNNETATFTTTGTQTEVGSSENSYSLVWDGTAKATNYTISESIGTLTVNESTAQITVTTTGGEFTYDGKAHGATVSVSELPKGYTLVTATSSATATDVTENSVPATCDTLVIHNAAGVDVTSRLKLKKTDGEIKINPATLTVKTPEASKVYDGTPLTAAGSITGFVNGEEASFTTTGTQTKVGGSKNTYSLAWDKTAKESNYTIVEDLGTLTVTEYAEKITVTTTGGEFPYDGKAHGATVAVSALPKGYTLETATSNATATNVADETVTAKCDTLVIRNAEGEDVTSKLNISYTDGTIKINPATLTVKTPSDSKTYDGTALTAAGTISGFVNGETATFETTGSQTEVGHSTNSYKLTWDKTAAESNYTLSESLGTLVVTENSSQIVVTTTGGTFTYDGQPHGATVSVSTLPAGYRLETAKSNDTATHVADGVVEANCDELVIRNAEGVDVTKKLNLSYVDGSITIIPATLTIITSGASKTYDGTALTASGSIDGFVNGETATFEVTGSQTEVGDSKNTYSLDWDGTAKETDYSLSEIIGTLVVNEYALPITVTTTGGIFTYDGKAHTATVKVSELPAGYHVEEASSDATVTNVVDGEVEATCNTLVIKNAAGEDVTEKLNISYKNDTIQITPASVVVVTESDSKVYDGTALTAPGTMKGLVEGETAGFEVTGVQRLVGSSDNTYEITWAVEDGREASNAYTAKASNYKVSETVGKLTVTDGSSDQPVDQDNVVTKVHEAGEYGLGDMVTFDITVTNIYDKVQTITISELEGVTITGNSVFENVEPGAVVTTQATYTITEADIVAGEFINTVTAKFSDGKTFENTDKVDPVDPKSLLSITKETTSTPVNGETYVLGEMIEYKITATNDGNLTLTDITVTDELTGDEWTVESLEPKASKEFTAKYEVTEADILAGKVVNVATGKGTSPDPEKPDVPVDPGEKEDPTEPKNGHLTITKETTSTPANGQTYALGETITYRITAKNDGNLTLTNVTVTDELTGNVGENAWTIESIAPGESRELTAEYAVTEADITAGTVHNVATATAQSPDPEHPEVPATSNETADPTDDRNPQLEVTKAVTSTPAAANGRYQLGETITYAVTVANTGNLTLQNITVQDVLTRPDGTSAVPSGLEGGLQTIAELAPGASQVITYTHVVTEQDLGGNLMNAVTVGGDPIVPDPTPDPENPEPRPGDEDDETVVTEDPENCSIIVTKQNTNMTDEAIVLAGAQFHVALFSGAEMTPDQRVGEVQTITFGENQATSSTTFTGLRRGTYYVAETDANGNVITSGEYDGGAFVPVYADDNHSVVIADNGAAANFSFTNQFLITPNDYYIARQLTITKNVKNSKGKAAKSNQTFYAGIFTDEQHTQLAENVSQNIVALKMNGKSSATQTVEVTVPENGEAVTLYVTEVTSNGVPVEKVANFKYDVEVDNMTVALSSTSEDATTTITNTSTVEDNEEECENNSEEKSEEKSEEESNTTNTQTRSVQTGDETPITTFAFLLLASAAILLIFAGKRRKEDAE